jgi:thiol-disulfide isomerase/thioredoxin
LFLIDRKDSRNVLYYELDLIGIGIRRRIMQSFWRPLTSMIVILSMIGAWPVRQIVAQAREKVQDLGLRIKDVQGREFAPFNLDGKRASVFIFLTYDCPISNRYAPEIRRIAQAYRGKDIRFYLVYVDQDAGVEKIETHLREYGLSEIPAIKDANHELVKSTGVTITPEVAVIGKQGEIFYRGRIDNLYAELGKPRRQVTQRELRDALDAVLKGREVDVPRTKAVGCFIGSQN